MVEGRTLKRPVKEPKRRGRPPKNPEDKTTTTSKQSRPTNSTNEKKTTPLQEIKTWDKIPAEVRKVALDFALGQENIQLAGQGGKVDPHTVVANAQVYESFLKGKYQSPEEIKAAEQAEQLAAKAEKAEKSKPEPKKEAVVSSGKSKPPRKPRPSEIAKKEAREKAKAEAEVAAKS